MRRSEGVIPDRFQGQVALVVGGAQGIGKAIAMRLAREGARVVIGDVDTEKMNETLCQEGAKAPCCAEDEGRPFGVAL